MNLQPAKHLEPVTILMVPFDQYSAFPKAVDQLIKETSYPFKLVIVEGNAPENIRQELENRKRKHKNIQIIFSAHHPRLAEAFNLGLVHARTSRVVLMHNGLLVRPGWLSNLIDRALVKEGVLCPYISYASDEPFSFMHACLVSKQLLDEMGLFDESVGAPLWSADFMNRLRSKGVNVHREPSAVLDYHAGRTPKGDDLRFFRHQWDDPHAHQTLAYFRQKWGSAPEERLYTEWLARKKAFQHRKTGLLLPGNTIEVPIWAPKQAIDLKKFIDVLRRA